MSKKSTIQLKRLVEAYAAPDRDSLEFLEELSDDELRDLGDALDGLHDNLELVRSMRGVQSE